MHCKMVFRYSHKSRFDQRPPAAPGWSSYKTALLFLSGWLLSACCSHQLLEIDPAFAQVPTQLEIDSEGPGNGGRVFYLPECCWPEIPESDPESLLPGRAGTPIYSGLDSLSRDQFSLIRHRSFALLTNATGTDRNLAHSLDLMIESGVKPSLVFEPEHGLYGHLDEVAGDGIRRDPVRDLRILSLYSTRRKPAPEHLEGIDLIVVDIQNLPVRCYTYISTLTYLMEMAEELNIELMILDRPNPYGFWEAQGPILNQEYVSFVGTAPVPFMYSLTPGEYARYMKALRFQRMRLTVVRVAGYTRGDIDAPVRGSWINPSPNIPSLESALVYPGVVFYEGTRFSLGRGTTRPFIYSGAPWLNSTQVLAELKALNLPGVEFTEVVFTPTSSHYQGQTCRGIQINPVSARFDSLRTGYEYMRIVRRLHPDQFQYLPNRQGHNFIDLLWGGPGYRLAIEQDLDWKSFRSTWIDDAHKFERLVAPYRLY
ncbi:MAG: DUF1343 domain-containing protein [Leptospiraceae bacterium]|nr:DUF1343 domain-containing protein [Leptospiraceae bacterium]MCB1315098.1 DUF1343 domain-containing protein [Leptospiraceae bacterium]